jgi:hypothetical protein
VVLLARFHSNLIAKRETVRCARTLNDFSRKQGECLSGPAQGFNGWADFGRASPHTARADRTAPLRKSASTIKQFVFERFPGRVGTFL